jgi:hypothetical protein
MMKKLRLMTILVIVLVLTGCNLPGFETGEPLDQDDAMATEISRILTGTPIQVDVSPTVATEEIEAPEETEEIEETEAIEEGEPTEPEDTTPEPTEPDATEAPTSTPAPTDTPVPTPTATLAEEYPTKNLGDPTWVDNMDNGDNWPTGNDKYTAIKFEGGFLKLTALTDLDGWRVSWPTLDDFYLETTLQTPDCDGSDHFGLMFRVPADSQATKGYLFGITCDGRYSLRRWDGQTMHFPVDWTSHDAIQKGEKAINKLGVLARGEDIALYVNGQKVKALSDSSYLDGKFGFFVGGTNVENLTVWVDQVRYWDDP